MTRRITTPQPPDWTGGFVERELGVTVVTDESSVVPVDRLVGLALRRNPRRAHLLVSTVLAKHVPTDPGVALTAASLLGVLVARALGVSGQQDVDVTALGDRLADVLEGGSGLDPLREELARARVFDPALSVVGYAETATGLGRVVADTLGAAYIHSTRQDVVGVEPFAGFQEEHSHATDHRLLPRDDWFRPGGTVVLVDDELSTGSTIVNTIRALHAAVPQRRWCVAALVDLRSPADRARFDELAAETGSRIDVVALGTGSVELPDGLLQDAATVVERADAPTASAAAGAVEILDLTALPGVPSDRFGTRASERPDTLTGLGTPDAVAAAVAHRLEGAHDVLVLGTEEFIAFPLSVADRLATRSKAVVRFSTTTRSPIAAFDRPDYAIATATRFEKYDVTVDDEPDRFAYNLTRDGRRFDHVVVLPEPGLPAAALAGPGSLTEALARVCDRVTAILLAAPPFTTEPSDA